MELIRKYKQQKLTTADVRTLNNTVIAFMVLVAVTSIFWSVCLHILSGDFHQGIIGAKLVFHDRDFSKLNARASESLYKDLNQLINEVYNDAAEQNSAAVFSTTQPNTEETPTTAKPKVRKLAHVFQTSSNMHAPVIEPDDEADDEVNTTALPVKYFNVTADRNFVAIKTIDIYASRWSEGVAVKFIYSFPLLSEIVAIIWTAMCLIYQSSVKKYWGLPKPWRIVVPSILIFTLMSVSSLIYTILANGFLKTFCKDLRENLSNPDALSCGQAMSVLRPMIREHEFSHDAYLYLFRISYMITLVLWALALLVMVLRYVFAIDFQLVDINYALECSKPTVGGQRCKEPEFTEVLLSSPQAQQQLPKLLLHVDELQKSEDDFQSAKSQLSEVVTPLLEHTTQPKLA